MTPESAVTLGCSDSMRPPGPVRKADEYLARKASIPVKVRHVSPDAVGITGVPHSDEAVVASRGWAVHVFRVDVEPQAVPNVAGNETGVDRMGEGTDVHLVQLAPGKPLDSCVIAVVVGPEPFLGRKLVSYTQTGFDVVHHLCHVGRGVVPRGRRQGGLVAVDCGLAFRSVPLVGIFRHPDLSLRRWI